MLTKKQQMLENWIRDTQMFQRIAGTPEMTREQLTEQWLQMRRPGEKKRAADSAATHLIIQQEATKAGQNRKN